MTDQLANIVRSEKMPALDINRVHYSDKYSDEKYEYRHITLPKEFSKYIPRTHLMTETEWRNLGIQQSPGWVHFMIHGPEPHVLLFRRPLSMSLVASQPEGGKENMPVSSDEPIDECEEMSEI